MLVKVFGAPFIFLLIITCGTDVVIDLTQVLVIKLLIYDFL